MTRRKRSGKFTAYYDSWEELFKVWAGILYLETLYGYVSVFDVKALSKFKVRDSDKKLQLVNLDQIYTKEEITYYKTKEVCQYGLVVKFKEV